MYLYLTFVITQFFNASVINKLVCNIIVAKLVPAVLKNFCNLEAQKIKKININTKKRKLLKLK
jgi:hypothetical protein